MSVLLLSCGLQVCLCSARLAFLRLTIPDYLISFLLIQIYYIFFIYPNFIYTFNTTLTIIYIYIQFQLIPAYSRLLHFPHLFFGLCQEINYFRKTKSKIIIKNNSKKGSTGISRVLLYIIIIILYIYYTSDYTVSFFYIVLKTANNNNIIIVHFYFFFSDIQKKTLLPSQARALKINYHEKTTSQFLCTQNSLFYNSGLCSLYEPF